MSRVNTIQEKRFRAAQAQRGITAIPENSGMSALMDARHESKDADPDAFDLVGEVARWREANRARLTKPHAAADGSAANKIIVCVRKRPVLPALGEQVSNANFDCITCCNPCTYLHGKEEKLGLFTGRLKAERKQFDHTFGGDPVDGSNEAVYAAVAAPLVDEAIEGGVCTVLAFGQTGSGKTFTQTYIQERAAEQIFGAVAGTDTQVMVSYFENQGDLCLDLLAERASMPLRTDGDGHVHVVGLTETVAPSAEAALALAQTGAAERATAPTGNNPHSSRSHAILRYTMRGPDGAFRGMLRVVDLAGSERKKHVRLHGRERQEESKAINWSLGCLKECIRDQYIKETRNPRQHIKYRNCRLTLLLKECFTSAKQRTVFIACLSPLIAEYESTRSTLDYARQLKVVEDAKAARAAAAATGEKRKKPIQEWSRKKVVGFVGWVENGRFKKYADAFATTNGKALVQIWSGDFAKKCNGNAVDGQALYEHVSKKKMEAKAMAAKACRANRAGSSKPPAAP
jgi:kinesin family protein 2/24